MRIEDLDPQRSKAHFTNQVIEDMKWLGLDWDEGPNSGGAYGPYSQNDRREFYEMALNELKDRDLVYPCFCTRKELRAASAPHQEDGIFIYGGTCRGLNEGLVSDYKEIKKHAWRIKVPDESIRFTDLNYGLVEQNIKSECGDFVLARADGVHAYQLAVVIDDALMGVNQIIRGSDLIDSSPRQIYLHKVFGFEEPTFGHVPLLRGENADRLSKRHKALDLGQLRNKGWKSEDVIGLLAYKAGMIQKPEAVQTSDLISLFDWTQMPKQDIILTSEDLKL